MVEIVQPIFPTQNTLQIFVTRRSYFILHQPHHNSSHLSPPVYRHLLPPLLLLNHAIFVLLFYVFSPLFITTMHYSASSPLAANLLQKYFPDLVPLTAPHEENVDVDHAFSPLPASLLSSAVLAVTHVGKSSKAVDFGVVFSGLRQGVKVSTRSWRETAPHVHCSDAGLPVEEEVNVVEEERSAPSGGDKKSASWSDMPKYLLSGAVSTTVSRTSVAPLERIKLECIIQGSRFNWIDATQWIWEKEGLVGFWRGNLLNLFRMVPFKSINFICYDMYCDHLLRSQGKSQLSSQERLIGGGVAGVAATILCIPLDTIRTRLVAPGGEALGGVVGCVVSMVNNEGILSLYKGLTPALISLGPSSAVFFAVYDLLKSSYLSRQKAREIDPTSNNGQFELGVARTLIYSSIAGTCAETVTYPLEVIRRQLQLQQATRLGLAAAFVKMVERHGVASLFSGLVPSTLQVLPSVALNYLFYEMMKSTLKIN